MMKNLLLAFALLVSSFMSFAADEQVYRIDTGGDYRYYSNDDLRRRVWELERAVMQLQSEVFRLSIQNQSSGFRPGGLWTCQVQAFGKTHVASNSSRNTAVALVLKKCGDASNPIHCRESNVRCESE